MLPLGTAAPDFALSDAHGRSYRLEDFRDAQLLLVAFISNHCPFVQHMIDGLLQFARDYAPKRLSVVAINPNDVSAYPEDSPANMARLAAQKAFPFPLSARRKPAGDQGL